MLTLILVEPALYLFHTVYCVLRDSCFEMCIYAGRVVGILTLFNFFQLQVYRIFTLHIYDIF